MAETPLDVPVTDQDMADWDFNQNPYPIFEQWRAQGPVIYDNFHDRYLVTSYKNCARVLGNAVKFSAEMGRLDFIRNIFGGVVMVTIDSPRHDEVRGIWASEFRRDSLESRREMIDKVVASRLEPFVERVRSGEVVDAAAELTRGIPTLVIANMMGVEPAMLETFNAWSDEMSLVLEGRLYPPPRGQMLAERGIEAAHAMNQYVAEIIGRRRREGGGKDLVSQMVFQDRTTLSEEEIIANNTQLVFAGNETTAKLMAATIVALGQHPEQRRAIAADRSLVPQAIEEVSRWSTTTQSVARYAVTEESDVEGIVIPYGSEVMPLQGAANRDPGRWERPAEFDIFRPVRQHLGFGFGMHVCLGINLARLEIAIWLNRFLDALPEYELAAPIEYSRLFTVRGPVAVWIRQA